MADDETKQEDGEPQQGAGDQTAGAQHGQEPDAGAQQGQAPDETEAKLDRIVAQRLGKYAERTRKAEEEARRLRDEVQNLRGAVTRPATTPTAERVWTQEELQALVDGGQITPAQLSGQLVKQGMGQVKQELRAEVVLEQRRGAALSEVRQYMEKVPTLDDSSSQDFHRVARAASDIAEDLGLDIQDPRVQRQALRQVFGSLDTLGRKEKAREFARSNADTHVETNRGPGPQDQNKNTKDPLANVDRRYIEHWERLGYTRKEMEHEAKYIRRPIRTRAS